MGPRGDPVSLTGKGGDRTTEEPEPRRPGGRTYYEENNEEDNPWKH
jgi:hypothetical protein